MPVAEGYPCVEEHSGMSILGAVEIVNNGDFRDACRRGTKRLREALDKGNLRSLIMASPEVNLSPDPPTSKVVRYM
ncbi:hypothetical protein HDU96_004160, partial [Phlyctochytrium bullatum]